MSARGRDVPVALAAALAVALALWCIVCAPADTEIFVPVHPLACRYPMSYLNTFEGGCGAYLLDFGLFRYHRAYDYIGATSSLLYWPFWAIWRSPYSFYLLGAALLGVFSLGAARALDLGARYALIPLCYFPLAYLFIQDTGPIRMAFLSVPALGLLVRGTLRDSRRSRQVLFGVLAAVLVLVCVEDKPFYLFVAPMVLVCAIAFGTSAGGDSPVSLRGAARQGRAALLAFGVIVTLGLAVQFLAGKSDGVTYLSYLRLRMSIIESQGIIGTGKLLVYYTWLPTSFARRMFGWDRPLMLVSLLCLIPSSLLASALWRARAVKARVLGWMGAAYASGAAVALFSGKELQPHHFVFLHVPLVLLLMHAAGRNAAGWNAVMKYLIVSTPLTIAILMWHFPPQSILERGPVFAYLSRPDVALTHVVSTSDLYDQQAVYGDDAQLVTFADPLFPSTRDAAGPLMALARTVSRDILYVCRTCTRPEVQTAFAGTAIDEIEIGVTSWKLFNVRQPGR